MNVPPVTLRVPDKFVFPEVAVKAPEDKAKVPATFTVELPKLKVAPLAVRLLLKL